MTIDTDEIIKTLTSKIHVEVDCLIGSEDVSEQDRILGHIEMLADIIRYIETNQ